MINPQLQTYLIQAKATAKMPEVVRAELSANGWGEVDIQEVLASLSGGSQTPPAQSFSAPALNVSAPIATGWNYWLLGIIGLIVIGGSYLAYVFFSNSDSPPASLGGPSSSLSCAQLLPDADFERITGQSAANYVAVPLFYEVVPGTKMLACDYVSREQYEKNLQNAKFSMSAEDFKKLTGGDDPKVSFRTDGKSGSIILSSDVMANISTHTTLAKGADYEFSVTTSDKDMTEQFNTITALYRGTASNTQVDVNVDAGAYSQEGSISLQTNQNSATLTSTAPSGQTVSMTMRFAVTNILVGAQGFYIETTSDFLGSSIPPSKSINVLSSDRHSTIDIDGIEKMTVHYDEKTFMPGPYVRKEPWLSKEAAIELAKIINANISR